jgi:hypothetical protein
MADEVTQQVRNSAGITENRSVTILLITASLYIFLFLALKGY